MGRASSTVSVIDFEIYQGLMPFPKIFMGYDIMIDRDVSKSSQDLQSNVEKGGHG